MSALADRSNPILDYLKPEISKLVWQCFDDIKDKTIPIHLHVFGVPIGINVAISNLQGIVELLVGPKLVEDLNTSAVKI